MVNVSAITSGVLNVGVMITVMILILGGIVLLYLLSRRLKRYSQFKCIIFYKDGFGQEVQEYDRAGIFVDGKTKNKRLFLQKNNVGLDPNNIPVIADGKGKKTVYLFRHGLKNFQYIKFRMSETFNVIVGEEDVNWAINAYERCKVMFSQTLLMQLLPFLAIAFVSIIILIIFIYFFKNFDVLRDVAVNLKEAAQAIAQANSGTTVIGGG